MIIAVFKACTLEFAKWAHLFLIVYSIFTNFIFCRIFSRPAVLSKWNFDCKSCNVMSLTVFSFLLINAVRSFISLAPDFSRQYKRIRLLPPFSTVSNINNKFLHLTNGSRLSGIRYFFSFLAPVSTLLSLSSPSRIPQLGGDN